MWFSNVRTPENEALESPENDKKPDLTRPPNGQRKFSAFWPAVYWHGCCTFVRSERPTNGTNSPPKLQVEVHWLGPESLETAILFIQNTHFDIMHFVTMHSVLTDLL